MKSPFERYEIDHLSPSSLNLFAEAPALWCLKYLHKFEEEANPRMWRGSAVEAGLDHWLYQRDPEAALKAALDHFELYAVGEASDEVEAERKSVAPMLDQACLALCGKPTPVGRQFKVEHYFDGIEVPVIGFLDYLWDEDGLDLKTTDRIPSQVPARHARQVALYATAKQRPFRLLYASTKRAEIMGIDDVALEMKRLAWSAHAIRRALSISSDAFEVSKLYTPDFGHPYLWKSEAARELATKVWTL